MWGSDHKLTNPFVIRKKEFYMNYIGVNHFVVGYPKGTYNILGVHRLIMDH